MTNLGVEIEKLRKRVAVTENRFEEALREFLRVSQVGCFASEYEAFRKFAYLRGQDVIAARAELDLWESTVAKL